ncbi:MAG: nucleoside-triphosphatase [Candidatus Aminicenantes bacterium]
MIFILSGPVHGGKTTLLESSLPGWASRGLAFGGFLSVAVLDGQGQTEYDLLDLKEGRCLPFLRRTGEPDAERTGPFFFVARTLDLARAIIYKAAPGELLVVDEVGPLELEGRGLWPVLRKVIFRPEQRSILVAREEILERFVASLRPSVPLIFDVRDPNVRKLMDGSLFGTTRLDEDPS